MVFLDTRKCTELAAAACFGSANTPALPRGTSFDSIQPCPIHPHRKGGATHSFSTALDGESAAASATGTFATATPPPKKQARHGGHMEVRVVSKLCRDLPPSFRQSAMMRVPIRASEHDARPGWVTTRIISRLVPRGRRGVFSELEHAAVAHSVKFQASRNAAHPKHARCSPSSNATVNTQGVHVCRQGLAAAAVACPKVRAARWLCVRKYLMMQA